MYYLLLLNYIHTFMDLVGIGIFAIACVLLGIVGGFAAKSWFSGLILAVFVFIGWVLWRWFKLQTSDEEPKGTTEEKKE